MSWNPRFVAYATAHGHTPESMIQHDRLRWPGGQMCGFILWIGQQWQQWREAFNYRGELLGPAEHAAFDQWLASTQRPQLTGELKPCP